MPARSPPGRVPGGEHEPDDGEAQREDRGVAGRRGRDRDGGDAHGHAAGEEQQSLRGHVVAVAVVEDGEPDPRPPQRHEEAERDPHAVHLGAVDDQARDLADREHEHEVEVQLDPRDALARLGHATEIFAQQPPGHLEGGAEARARSLRPPPTEGAIPWPSPPEPGACS
jgi:hypothetical protein